jgi:hypothetical protein
MTSAGIKIDGSSLPVTAVTISNARIERSSRGVDVASYADVSIVDSRFSYNGTGVFVSPTTYTSRVSIHRTIIDHSSSDGVAVDGGSQTAIVSISGSELDGNFFGVNAFHSKALVHVSDSRLVSNEIYGVIEQYSANVVLSGNLIGTNGTSGVQNNDAGFVYTMKNNAIRDNGLYNLLKPLTTLTFD